MGIGLLADQEKSAFPHAKRDYGAAYGTLWGVTVLFAVCAWAESKMCVEWRTLALVACSPQLVACSS